MHIAVWGTKPVFFKLSKVSYKSTTMKILVKKLLSQVFDEGKECP